MSNKNSKFEPHPVILVRFARAFYENESLNKSQLHAISRTNWHYLKKYLVWLTENDYLGHGKDKSYKPTSVGWEMFRSTLKYYDQIKKKNTDFNVRKI